MTGPLRHCDRPGCRLCGIGDRDARDLPSPDTLATLLVAIAMLVWLAAVLFVLLPILAGKAVPS